MSDHGRDLTVFSMSPGSGLLEISRGKLSGGACTSRIMGIARPGGLLFGAGLLGPVLSLHPTANWKAMRIGPRNMGTDRVRVPCLMLQNQRTVSTPGEPLELQTSCRRVPGATRFTI